MLRLCLLALFIESSPASWSYHRYRNFKKSKSSKSEKENQVEDTISLVPSSPRVAVGGSKTKLTVYPEILIVVDEALHTKLGSSSTKTKEYVTLFMSAVNLRFKDNMKTLNVELSIVDIDIIKSSEESVDYISNNIVAPDSLDAKATLSALGSHYFSNPRNDIVYDMVLVLTGLNLCIHKGRSCQKSTAGYAYVGGACRSNPYLKKINAVGIIEDDGGYSGAVVAAHEIGHLLGATHDGTASPSYMKGPSARSCAWSQGYIMSDLRRTKRGLQWSKCSESQMFSYLSSGASSCLLNKPRRQVAAYQLKTFSQLAAAAPSADQQCKMKAGTKACFHDNRVCTQLFCVDGKTGSCISYRPAVDGTKCNRNGICFRGDCINSTKSKSV